MRTCAGCREELEERFRFCPWCGVPQRVKIVDFFRAHPLVEGDRGKALRVSRYLGDSEKGRHVRFSVWNEAGPSARAEAAVSLDEGEAARLAGFLTDTATTPEESETARLL
jgi:hypothetical protein